MKDNQPCEVGFKESYEKTLKSLGGDLQMYNNTGFFLNTEAIEKLISVRIINVNIHVDLIDLDDRARAVRCTNSNWFRI
jgi:hypothetical protein